MKHFLEELGWITACLFYYGSISMYMELWELVARGKILGTPLKKGVNHFFEKRFKSSPCCDVWFPSWC